VLPLLLLLVLLLLLLLLFLAAWGECLLPLLPPCMYVLYPLPQPQ
jgi:hypothetical protein